jgi:hypothetical protein
LGLVGGGLNLIDKFNKAYDKFVESKTGMVLGYVWFFTIVMSLVCGK